MKMNWGFKILFVYILFVLGILSLVWMSSMQNRDLVSEDYYADEIIYQKTIDRLHNTSTLSSSIEISKDGDILKIIFPTEFKEVKTNCEWTLYFAADKKKDLSGFFSTEHGTGLIKLNKETRGNYLLKLNFKEGIKEYYYEKLIQL